TSPPKPSGPPSKASTCSQQSKPSGNSGCNTATTKPPATSPNSPTPAGRSSTPPALTTPYSPPNSTPSTRQRSSPEGEKREQHRAPDRFPRHRNHQPQPHYPPTVGGRPDRPRRRRHGR